MCFREREREKRERERERERARVNERDWVLMTSIHQDESLTALKGSKHLKEHWSHQTWLFQISNESEREMRKVDNVIFSFPEVRYALPNVWSISNLNLSELDEWMKLVQSATFFSPRHSFYPFGLSPFTILYWWQTTRTGALVAKPSVLGPGGRAARH